MTVTDELDNLLKDFNEKDQKFDEKFRSFHKEEMKKASEKGEKDGMQNTPGSADDDYTPAEQEIISSYKAKIEEVGNMGSPYLSKLHEQYLVKMSEELKDFDPSLIDSELNDVHEKEKEKIKELEEERDHKEKALKNDVKLRTLKEDLDISKRHFNVLSSQENRITTDSVIPDWIYWIIFSIVAFGESAMNYFVFELFGESQELTWMFTLFVGLIFAITAHFQGFILKKNGLKNLRTISMSVFSLIIISFLAYIIGSLREYFITELGVMPQYLSSVSFYFFVLIVIVVFVIGALSSYFHSDSNPQFLKTKRIMEEAREKYNSRQALVDSKIENIIEEYRGKIKEVKEKIDNREYNIKEKEAILKSLLQRTIAHYNTILHELQAVEKLINQSLMETLWTYRTANNAVNPDTPNPSIWNEGVNFNKPMCQRSEMTNLNYKNKINLN